MAEDNRVDDSAYEEWCVALLPLHYEQKDGPEGTGDNVVVTSGRPVLMQYADQGLQRHFLEALLELPWLPSNIRRATANAVGRPLRQRSVEREVGRTLALKQMIAEVEARMRAAGERPPKGDIHTAAIEEVAEKGGIEPDALRKRIQRLKEGSAGT